MPRLCPRRNIIGHTWVAAWGFRSSRSEPCWRSSDDRSRDCATVDAIASTHLTEIDRKLADLSALRREIAALVETCQGGTIGECRILDALGPGGFDR
ncbi:MAG: MerR family DNA-binding protein [Sphingobium sp.]